MGVYYPVAMAVLLVRLDEGFEALPPEAVVALEGDVSGRFTFMPGADKWLESGEMTTGTGDPNKPSRVFALRVLPSSMTIQRNSYRNADECTLTIPWEDCPLDARSIRSMAVAAYIGCVPAATWGRAISRGVSLGASAWGRDSVDIRTLVENPQNLRFTGFRDEVVEEHGEGGSHLRISCRDWTQVLIDTPVPSSVYRSIRWDDPVEDVIMAVLGTIACMEGAALALVGETPGTRKAGSEVKSLVLRGQHHKAGKSGKKVSRAPKVKAETYWDLLTDLSVMAGYVLYADPWLHDGSVRPCFVLEKPSEMYAAGARSLWTNTLIRGKDAKTKTLQAEGWKLAPAGLPVFADRKRQYPGTTGRVADAPVLVYGQDLASLSFSQKSGHDKVPSVQLVSVEGKKTIRATYPPTAHAADVHPSGQWAQDQVRVIPVSGAGSEAELAVVAKQVFEELGRGERTCALETQELASFGGDNSDADLLELRAGMPFEILFAHETEAGGAVDVRCRIEAMAQAELARWFVEVRGLPSIAATALAAVLKGPRGAKLLNRRWYTREVTLDWSSDDGVSVKVTGVNYLNVSIQRGVRGTDARATQARTDGMVA